VEDENTVRMLTSVLLKKAGYKVFEASNGIEALEVLESSSSQIDLVLTDVVMPKMGGRELVQKIEEIYPYLKVIFMSGYPSDMTDEGAVDDESGEVNMIYKPFTREELFSKIREIIDN